MQSQAIHRVIRFGQKEVVQVSRLIVNNSFHAYASSVRPYRRENYEGSSFAWTMPSNVGIVAFDVKMAYQRVDRLL